MGNCKFFGMLFYKRTSKYIVFKCIKGTGPWAKISSRELGVFQGNVVQAAEDERSMVL